MNFGGLVFLGKLFILLEYLFFEFNRFDGTHFLCKKFGTNKSKPHNQHFYYEIRDDGTITYTTEDGICKKQIDNYV